MSFILRRLSFVYTWFYFPRWSIFRCIKFNIQRLKYSTKHCKYLNHFYVYSCRRSNFMWNLFYIWQFLVWKCRVCLEHLFIWLPLLMRDDSVRLVGACIFILRMRSSFNKFVLISIDIIVQTKYAFKLFLCFKHLARGYIYIFRGPYPNGENKKHSDFVSNHCLQSRTVISTQCFHAPGFEDEFQESDYITISISI